MANWQCRNEIDAQAEIVTMAAKISMMQSCSLGLPERRLAATAVRRPTLGSTFVAQVRCSTAASIAA
jgi:hypothetical protein